MFSKSLFKQSCKANGVMWFVITLAVCFTLSCVMLISGNGSVSDTKNAIQDTIVEGELTSALEQRSLTYYDIAASAMEHFDSTYASAYSRTYTLLAESGLAEEASAQKSFLAAYAAAAEELQNTYYPQLLRELGYDEDSGEATEVKGILFYVLNPIQQDGSFLFDDYYTSLGETPVHYTDLLATISEPTHVDEREHYVMNNCSVFLADTLSREESIDKILDALSSYGVTREKYGSFGFDDYARVRQIAREAIINYRARLEFRTDGLSPEEITEDLKADVRSSVAKSLLASLPKEVADALDEVGRMDLYGTLVGTIFFKMAGLLLPIIYMIMTSNALIAGQVDSGSMAYILATSTKRRTIAFTQAVYLAGSLFVMFLLTCVTGILCLNAVNVDTELTAAILVKINFGAFLVMFAMSGICYLASCLFDRSKNAMALGGGLSMFFLVATMLGLFGSEIMPSILRMKALNYFNYVSLITLFDTASILEGTGAYRGKFLILFIVGLVCYCIGAARFRKKDLPL